MKLAHSRCRSLLPSQLCLDHSHCPVLAPATLAALPSTRAIPDRDVFYVAPPSRPIVFARFPSSLTATLVASPAMSLLPVAPFFLHPSNFAIRRSPNRSFASPCDHSPVRLGPVYPAAYPTPCCGIRFLGDSGRSSKSEKYQGGKSASAARQSWCDVGAV